jgi:hypothetical protein
VKKPLLVIGTLLCNGLWINLVLRARIETNQGFINAKKPLYVIEAHAGSGFLVHV